MSIAYTQMNTSTIYANNITARQLHILRNVSIGMLEHCMVESSLLPLALSFSFKLSLLSTIFTLIMNAINFPGNGKVFSSSHCMILKTRQKKIALLFGAQLAAAAILFMRLIVYFFLHSLVAVATSVFCCSLEFTCDLANGWDFLLLPLCLGVDVSHFCFVLNINRYAI